MKRDWKAVEDAAAELWCCATWCPNKARRLNWKVCSEARTRYDKGDRSESVCSAYRDYNALYDFAVGRGSRRNGRASWFCVQHTAEIERCGSLVCTVEGCAKKASGRTAYCPAHYQHWAKHGTTEYMSRKLPLEPALRAIAARGGLAALVVEEQRRQRWSRLLEPRNNGITMYFADELAVTVIGTHPAIVWGEDWWDKTALEPEMEYA